MQLVMRLINPADHSVGCLRGTEGVERGSKSQLNHSYFCCVCIILRFVYWQLVLHWVGYARTNVIGSRTSFIISSVRFSVHWNICIQG